LGKHDSIYSTVLHEQRSIDVYLPPEAEKDPSKRYETIYVLDGEWNTSIVREVVSFLRQVEFIPPVIIVSVNNSYEHGNSRDRDFAPTATAEFDRSGGARSFLAFFKEELIPYINEHYPSNGINTIHAHSLGGAFALYALVTDPSLFGGYVIEDPALWINKYSEVELVNQKLSALSPEGKAVYIAGRSGSSFEHMGVAKIESVFKQMAPPALKWKIQQYPDETHDSLKLKSTYDALKYAYLGYADDPIDFSPGSGIVVKGKPVVLRTNTDHRDIHYTTDGSEPNASSPKMDTAILVSDPSRTRFKSISTKGIYDQNIPHNLTLGEPFAPSDRSSNQSGKGWHFAFYSVAQNEWPDFESVKPFGESTTDRTVNINHPGKEKFAGSIDQYIDVPSDSYYIFQMHTAGKARFFVSDKKVMENNGLHGPWYDSVVVPLERGIHRVRLEFLHMTTSEDIQLEVFRYKAGDLDWSDNLVAHLE
jgi:predicted alpha/beta superfamily hydrolase